MNIIEKIRLKSMLRNCDYELAGTVLMQQYYDHNKDTELNRLLEAYMKSPGFDQAVKLIKYNEMFVFYFTESCKGGLYVRKSGKKVEFSQPTGEEPAVAIEQQENQADHAIVQTISEAAASDNSMDSADEEPVAVEASGSKVQKLHDMFDDLEQKLLSDRSARRIREAEQILEPIIMEAHRSQTQSEAEDASLTTNDLTPDLPMAEEDHDHHAPDPVPSESERVFSETAAADQTEIVSEHSDQADPNDHTAPFVPSVQIENESDSAEPSEHTTDPAPGIKEVTASHLDKWLKLGKLDKLEAEPEPPLQHAEDDVVPHQEFPAKPAYFNTMDIDPQQTRFPNVISTLLIDINDMKSQIEEYKARMYENSRDAVKLKKWINTLDDAVEEFTEAVRILSESRVK